MKVAIAPDFEHLLPPLSAAELAQLEANCIDDANHERMPPVVVWANHKHTIVDGHNQYRIRSKHRLKIKFAKMEFATRDEAKKYALDVQFGRRNSDASQRAIAYAKLPHNAGPGKPKANSANLPNYELAEKAGVSERTMRDAAKVVDNAAAAVVKAVESGEVKVSDAASVMELSKSEQLAALTKKRSGKAKTLKQAAADFDPASFKKTKAGTQKRKPADRKAAFQLLGKLIRCLDRLGLSADLDTELKAINQALKDS